MAFPFKKTYSMNEDGTNPFEDFNLNPDEIGDVDIKINPDFYIHQAIIKAQNSLLQPDLKNGFLLFSLFIEHIETIAEASGRLMPEYEDNIKEWKAKVDYDKKKAEEKTDQLKSLAIDYKLANFKLKLVMESVFKSKPINNPIRTY